MFRYTIGLTHTNEDIETMDRKQPLSVWYMRDPQDGMVCFVVQSWHRPVPSRYAQKGSEPARKAWFDAVKGKGLRVLVELESTHETIWEAYTHWRREVLRLGEKGQAELNFVGRGPQATELRTIRHLCARPEDHELTMRFLHRPCIFRRAKH